MISDPEQLTGTGCYNGLNFPKLTCKAFAIMDNQSKELIWGKNIKTKRECASLTKIMTCLVFFFFQ